MAAAGDKREKRKNYFYSEYEREYFDYLLDRTGIHYSSWGM